MQAAESGAKSRVALAAGVRRVGRVNGPRKLRRCANSHKPLHHNILGAVGTPSVQGIRLAPPPGAMSAMQAWYREGGPIMLLIALVGAVGLAILLERLYVIVFRSKNNGRVFIERVIQLVRVGRIEEAIKVCAGSKAALPDIGLLVLRSRSRDESDLQNVATAALLFVVPKLTRRLQYLRSLAVSAILL